MPDYTLDIACFGSGALLVAKDSFGVMPLCLEDNGIEYNFVTPVPPSPLPGTALSGSQDLYQWSAISSTSPFTMETWCLILVMSFWKFETRLKEWNFWIPLSSRRLHHRWYEKEEDESDTLFLSPF